MVMTMTMTTTMLLLLLASALMRTLLIQIARVLMMKMSFGLELVREEEKRQVVVLMAVLVFVVHSVYLSDDNKSL